MNAMKLSILLLLVLPLVNCLNCNRVNYKDWLFHDIGTSLDYKYINKRYSVSHDIKMTWTQSLNYCKILGLRLASFATFDEAKNATKLFSKYPHLFEEVIHIAGSKYGNDPWKWIPYEKKIQFKVDWEKGEPNNKEKEKCMALKKTSDGNFKFIDLNCDNRNSFLCEYDAEIPEYPRRIKN